MYDVLIIGSGVMGMSIARALNSEAYRIAVIDRDIPGKHASYKAGGMLGAQNEFNSDSALYRLALKSQQYFEPLAHSIAEEVGIDIEYRQSGLLKIAAEAQHSHQVLEQYEFLQQHNPQVRLLTNKDIQQYRNYDISFPTNTAFHIPEDHQINANRYTKALLASLHKRHIERIFSTEVTDIQAGHEGYSVCTNKGKFAAQKVIVAGGAWSHYLLNGQLKAHEPTGVKGEVMLFESRDIQLATTLFFTDGCYIVPKMKQRYLIGATSYFNDYSVNVTAGGMQCLLHQALTYVPALGNTTIIKHWSGVRPYTNQEKPVMDEIQQGLFVITGHYRNGILLSPVVGELIALWLKSGVKPEILNDFKLGGCTSGSYY